MGSLVLLLSPRFLHFLFSSCYCASVGLMPVWVFFQSYLNLLLYVPIPGINIQTNIINTVPSVLRLRLDGKQRGEDLD